MFIDANIFLEYLLKDKKWVEAGKFLGRISEGEVGMTSDFIVYSILLRISHEKKVQLMKDFTMTLASMKGLRIARFSPQILFNAVSLMEKNRLDFDDSLQVAFMQSLGIQQIVSLDRDFERVPGIKRIEPGG